MEKFQTGIVALFVLGARWNCARRRNKSHCGLWIMIMKQVRLGAGCVILVTVL